MKRIAPFTSKWLFGITGFYFLAGTVLFSAEFFFSGKDEAFQQLPFIVILGIVFSIMTFLGRNILSHLAEKQERQLLNFYLIKKFCRFMVAVIALVLYAFSRETNLLAFTINLVVFYFMEMTLSIILSNRIERCLKMKR